MKLTKKTAQMICDIESIIGSYCWNDNAEYGNGGYIRYPVWVKLTEKHVNDNGKIEKTQEWIKTSSKNLNKYYSPLSPKDVQTLEYHFGANELVIGKAIMSTLDYLENRYGIDFEDLEKKLK